ncbi:MAG TPA: Holliday junction resolvase RuvX [Candidatus Sulfotelmatobacter sp.]|nr:Holliday junction resolvase RuvX [Candidatus Sulfotelmatobacter sp.]
MLASNPADLCQRLAPGKRLLGLDVGSKTVGLALSDPGLVIASPLETIRRVKFSKDAEVLRGIIARQQVGGLLLGLPVNMDGSEGPRCQSVRQFAANLDKLMPELPMGFWDERLSTAAVTRTLLEADASRKRRAELVDKLAAAYILQGALDSLTRTRSVKLPAPP